MSIFFSMSSIGTAQWRAQGSAPFAFSTEIPDTAEERAVTLQDAHDVVEVFRHGLQVGADVARGVVDLMGYPGGKLADGGHLLRLEKLKLGSLRSVTSSKVATTPSRAPSPICGAVMRQ